jgi:hypothetical protein
MLTLLPLQTPNERLLVGEKNRDFAEENAPANTTGATTCEHPTAVAMFFEARIADLQAYGAWVLRKLYR